VKNPHTHFTDFSGENRNFLIFFCPHDIRHPFYIYFVFMMAKKTDEKDVGKTRKK